MIEVKLEKNESESVLAAVLYVRPRPTLEFRLDATAADDEGL
jgi:hypothetical protein